MLYPLAIEKGNATQAHGVIVPDIKGCFSAGSSFEEALLNAEEAIAAHLEMLCEDGAEIPKATEIATYINDPQFAGFVWALVDIDITPFLGKSEKINVTLPQLLIKRIDRFVKDHAGYKTRSGFLASAALNELSKTH